MSDRLEGYTEKRRALLQAVEPAPGAFRSPAFCGLTFFQVAGVVWVGEFAFVWSWGYPSFEILKRLG